MSLAGAAWSYLRFARRVEGAQFTDALIPTRWGKLRVALGNHYLRQARDAIAQRDYEAGFHLYRTGLARSPLNALGRLDLARLYVAFKRPDLTKAVLLERLPELTAHTDYLRAALEFLLQQQHDRDLLAICTQLLDLQLQPETRQLVALFAAKALFHRGDYDRAEDLLRGARLEMTAAGALLLARSDLERGYPELALLRLEDLAARVDAPDDTYVVLGQVRRQLGQTDRLSSNAVLRLASNPLSHAPRLDFLLIHHERRDHTAFDQEVADYFSIFSRDERALLALSDFAAHTGHPDLARRVQQHFATQGWPVHASALLTAEAQLASGDFAAGLDTLKLAARLDADAAKRLATVYDSLHAIALFGLNRTDEARLHLEHLLSRPNLRAENLQLVARRLIALGQSEHARAVLTRSVSVDPLNQTALTELVRIEAEGRHLDTLPSHVRRLLQLRKPSPEALALAAVALGSDLSLFHPEQRAVLQEIRSHADRRLAAVGP